jgi:CHAT domain-containing protein/Flp pilus assembly protein TadD
MDFTSQAYALLECGNYSKAKEIFQQAYELEKQNSQILYGLGLSCYWLGEYEKCIEFLTQALELKNQFYPLASVWIGWAYKKLNNHHLSQQYFKSVTESNDLPDNLDFENLLAPGLAFYGLEEYENAIKYFNQATELKPDSYEAWLYYGQSLYKAEMYDEIKKLEIFEKAIKIQPDYPFAYREKGRLYTKYQELEKALKNFNEAIKRKEDFHQAISNRGITLANLSKLRKKALRKDEEVNEIIEAEANKNENQAKIDCEKAINLRPQEPELWRNQGIMLSILEDNVSAIESYNQAITLKPDDHESYYCRGRAKFYLSQNKYSKKKALPEEKYNIEAKNDFNQALKFKKNYAEAFHWLGRLEQQMGNEKESLKNFEKAIEYNSHPHLSESWKNYKAIIKTFINQERKKFYTLIWESCKKTTPLNSQDAELYFIWGQVQLKLGKYKQAEMTFNNAIKRDKNYAEAYKEKADALIEQDDNLGNKRYYDVAIEAYQKAVEIKPKYWSAWDDLGWSYWEINKYNEAYNSWKNGLDNLLLEEDIEISTSERRKGIEKLESQKGLIELNLSMGTAKQIAGLWKQAQGYYEKALAVYDHEPKLREIYLVVLEKYIALCQNRRSKSSDEIDVLLTEGSDLLGRYLKAVEKRQDEYKKRWLQRRFATFDQLRVDQLVQNNQINEALRESEKRKRICLFWLTKEKSDARLESELYENLDNFEKLVDTKTAIIYWHVSPAAITTFIIKHRQPIIVFSGKAENNFETGLAAEQLLKFERWMRGWKRNYRTYRIEKEIHRKPKHNWRQSMESNLDILENLLDIKGIIKKLERNIKQLILIPHRDLHLLPLHYLFRKTNLTITYLPSAEIGSELNQFSAVTSVLNLVPNNNKNMRYAFIQAKAISILYPSQPILFSNQQANEVLNMFPGDTNSFQFNGHGIHDVENPEKSALLLGGRQKITLKDILERLEMTGYELVTLAACETGITSKQNLIDEYVGLVSGFLKKGASHVVSSLWKVDERATALLMIKFYQFLKEGENPAVALKLSQKWLRELTNHSLAKWYSSLADTLKEKAYVSESAIVTDWKIAASNNQTDVPFAHPYYWAAFTLTGRPPITLE